MASSDDEDEELKLAMALSMQRDSFDSRSNKAIIDLTSDDEGERDDDLERAIALSLQETAQPSMSAIHSTTIEQSQRVLSSSTTTMAELTSQAAPPSAASRIPANNLLISDRKAMETERLKRLEERKRKRTPSPVQPKKLMQKPRAPIVQSETRHLNTQLLPDVVLQYPKGVIKRTSATKFPRTDDITIDELLQAPIVNIAVISSFQWDAEWLSRKLSHSKIKQHWVMNARDVETQARWRREMEECGIPNLRIHFPPMNPAVGNAHSKYMLLVGEKKMRMVISTANMEPVYWGEALNDWQPAVLENSVFVVDLPRRANEAVGDISDLTPFGKELVHFLQMQQLDPVIIKGVLKFDFSETAHLAFVHSIGTPTDHSAHPTGLPGLSKAIQDVQLDKVDAIELDYAASSLGAIDETFLQRIYRAARGLSSSAALTAEADLETKIRLYYPTADTVKSSIGGPNCAGIISLNKKHYDSGSFPADCLRDYVSTRKGMLSHNKLLFARGRHKDGSAFAWVYVGSANLSESAWGAQKVLKSGKLGKLTMRNWECGVVVPVSKGKLQALELKGDEVPPMSIFEGTIEVPFEYPGERYRERKPWLQSY